MADPYEIARKEIQKNFPKLGGINKKCQFRSLGNPDYNTGSGQPTEDLNITFFVAGPFLSVGTSAGAFDFIRNDDDPILAKDKAFLVPMLNMQVMAKINDELIDPLGVVWRVKGVKVDPADATVKMWIRPIEEGS